MPDTVLWAWERRHDLRWVDTKDAAVAFLALSVELSGDRVRLRRRAQPLRLAAGTYRIAVARIQTSKARLDEAQRAAAAEAVAALGDLAGVRAVQVDFDATASERLFYRELLMDLRGRLRPETGLSMTALASWCLGDGWMEGLPVDEAVPMLFRMGADRQRVLRHFQAGGDFAGPKCRIGTGVSTDEPEIVPWIPRGRRLYVFNPEAWTEEALRDIRTEVNR